MREQKSSIQVSSAFAAAYFLMAATIGEAHQRSQP
jgi:hypothetical protein